MGRKYIRQIINQNFVYPNNEVPEYDLEIVHDINDNSVSGTVTNFSAVTATTTGITFSYNYTWAKNNAEPFISNFGVINLVSVHMMTPSQSYYKPWRCINVVSSTGTTITTSSGTVNTGVITPAMLGVNSFTNGTYYFEFRFIGHRAIYPICAQLSITPTVTPTPTPTPATPTPTPTPATPTPTPTPAGPTPTPTPTGEGISLQIYGRDIDGTPDTITFFYSVNGGGNINVPGYTGAALPSTCTLLYTITGLTEFDSVEFGTSIDCVMEGTTGISSCPSITTSATTYTYAVDAPSIQAVSISIDTGTIP